MNEHYTYTTVQSTAEAIFTDKGSKFIGCVFPVSGDEDFKLYLKKLRNEHTGARHFCYAYRLGKQSIVDRSNDDGEPSGTAGKPILNQLISAGITQAGLIVVRYFGGTLLGTSGLINAYKNAAKLSIESASIIEQDITHSKLVQISYARFNDFMSLVKRYELSYQNLQSGEDGIKFQIEIPLKIESGFNQALNNITQHE